MTGPWCRHRVEKLTSDVVVRALGALGIAAINQAMAKNPKKAIEFKAPITRDGPGWRADLDLPYGVTVAEVMDRRDKLASGLRRQLGCVWPEADHKRHPGRLILWVGDEDMTTARQPAWPLAKRGTADLFKPVPFGTDQRGRAVTVTLMFVSVDHRVDPADGQDVPAAPAGPDRRPGRRGPSCTPTTSRAPATCRRCEPVAHRYRAGDDDEDIEYCAGRLPRRCASELRRRDQGHPRPADEHPTCARRTRSPPSWPATRRCGCTRS